MIFNVWRISALSGVKHGVFKNHFSNRIPYSRLIPLPLCSFPLFRLCGSVGALPSGSACFLKKLLLESLNWVKVIVCLFMAVSCAGDLSSLRRVNLGPSREAWNFNHWTTREVPGLLYFIMPGPLLWTFILDLEYSDKVISLLLQLAGQKAYTLWLPLIWRKSWDTVTFGRNLGKEGKAKKSLF